VALAAAGLAGTLWPRTTAATTPAARPPTTALNVGVPTPSGTGIAGKGSAGGGSWSAHANRPGGNAY
jgi:hypothetical protein